MFSTGYGPSGSREANSSPKISPICRHVEGCLVCCQTERMQVARIDRCPDTSGQGTDGSAAAPGHGSSSGCGRLWMTVIWWPTSRLGPAVVGDIDQERIIGSCSAILTTLAPATSRLGVEDGHRFVSGNSLINESAEDASISENLAMLQLKPEMPLQCGLGDLHDHHDQLDDETTSDQLSDLGALFVCRNERRLAACAASDRAPAWGNAGLGLTRRSLDLGAARLLI